MRKSISKIGVKTSLLLIVFALILCIALSVFGYFSSYQAYSDFYARSAQEIAAMAANFVDGDKIKEYYDTLETDDYYDWLQQMFNNIKQEQNIMYMYIFVPAPELDRFTYILEAMIGTDSPENIASLGDIYYFENIEKKYLVPDIIARKPSTEKITASNPYGQGVMTWAPVFDSGGEFVAMVEVDISINLVFDMLTRYMTTAILISSVIIIIMVIIMAWFNHRIVTKPLRRLTASALNLVSGDELSYVAEIKTGDEMQTLSEALSKMSYDIRDYTKRLTGIAADKERIATELSVAASIQASLLPKPITGRDDFEVCGLNIPARIMGGNFYDFFFIDPNRLCVIIADVSGGGIPAVLFMVIARTMIKNQLMTGMPVDKAMTVLNTHLFDSTSNNMTVSVFAGVLDIPTGLFSYVNAGGNVPLLLRRGGNYKYISEQVASKLAGNRNVIYRKLEVDLDQGDRLFLYNDGVLGANGVLDGGPGADRLISLLNSLKVRESRPEDTLGMMFGELSAFRGSEEQTMDIGMLILEYSRGDKTQADITVAPSESSLQKVLAFIRKQLAENGLGGAFYAITAVTVEELFLLISRWAAGDRVTVRCGIYGSRVEIKIFYGKKPLNLLETAEGKDADAIRFIRSRASELYHDIQDGRNVLTMVHISQ